MAKAGQLPDPRSRRYSRLVSAFVVTLTTVLVWLLVATTVTTADNVAVDRLFLPGRNTLYADGYSSSLLLSYLVTRMGALGAVGVCLGQAARNSFLKQCKNRGFILTFWIGLGLVVVAALFIFREAPAILNTPPEIISRYAHYPNEFYVSAGSTVESLHLAAMLRLSVGVPLSVSSLVFIVLNHRKRRKGG